MNYIKEMNAFFDWLETNPSEATTQLLWFHLMGIANKSGWPEWFTVANLTLQAKVGVSENTIIKHRNYLKQSGRLDYQNLGKKKAGKYRIIEFTSNNEVMYAVKPAVITEVKDEVDYSALFKLDSTKLNSLYTIPENAKDSLRILLNTCKISNAGIDGLETVYSYLGQVEIEVIEKALKMSEGKPVNWFVKVINGFVLEGKLTAESLKPQLKGSSKPFNSKSNQTGNGWSGKPKLPIVGKELTGSQTDTPYVPSTEEGRDYMLATVRHADGKITDEELEQALIKYSNHLEGIE